MLTVHKRIYFECDKEVSLQTLGGGFARKLNTARWQTQNNEGSIGKTCSP